MPWPNSSSHKYHPHRWLHAMAHAPYAYPKTKLHVTWCFTCSRRADFASLRSLRAISASPADDVEAIGYSLLQMWLGDMPWLVGIFFVVDKGAC